MPFAIASGAWYITPTLLLTTNTWDTMQQLVIIEWRLDSDTGNKSMHLSVGAKLPTPEDPSSAPNAAGGHYQHQWDHTVRTFAFQMGAPCAFFETLGASPALLQHMMQARWFHQMYLAPLDLQIDYALYSFPKSVLAQNASALMRFKHMHNHPEDRLWDQLCTALQEPLLVRPSSFQSLLPQGFSSFLSDSTSHQQVEQMLDAKAHPNASAFFAHIERTLLQNTIPSAPQLSAPGSFIKRL